MTTPSNFHLSTTGNTDDCRAQYQISNIVKQSPKQVASRTPNIVDHYSGLLDALSPSQRRGLTARLANGYYDGWRPTRAQLIGYIQQEFGIVVKDHGPYGCRLRPTVSGLLTAAGSQAFPIDSKPEAGQ